MVATNGNLRERPCLGLAQHPDDSELFAACEDSTARSALLAAGMALGVDENTLHGLAHADVEAACRVANTPAHTAPGLRAKATIAGRVAERLFASIANDALTLVEKGLADKRLDRKGRN